MGATSSIHVCAASYACLKRRVRKDKNRKEKEEKKEH